MDKPSSQVKGQRPLAVSQQSAVVRLAWVFGARDGLMLLRLQMLAEIVNRRHKVLAIAPDLGSQDKVKLSSLGIEFADAAHPKMWGNPFAALLARRRLAQQLLDWRCSAAVIEDPLNLEASVRAAAQAGLNEIYPTLPALERGPAPSSARASWRTSLEHASAIFVPTANDTRLIEQSFQKSPPRIAVLAPVAMNLEDVRARPLPPLGDGLVLLGAASQSNLEPSAIAAAGRSLIGRCRFRVIGLDEHGNGNNVDGPPGLEILPDAISPDAMHSAVEAAHVVVIDDISASHLLLLAAALAVGRPVLVIDVAAYRDFVDVGVNGWLVADGDAAALTTTIATMLKRPDLLAGMARASRQKAERKIDRSAGWQPLLDIIGLADLRQKAA